MRIMMMNFGPLSREKMQYVSKLALLFHGYARSRLFILGRKGSALQRLAVDHGMDMLARGDSLFSRAIVWLQISWRLRNNSEPWILQCFDPLSFSMALRLARKKDYVNVVYTALAPEPPAVKNLEEQMHLVSAVIAGTSEIADTLVAGGFMASRLHTVHGCVDPSEYQQRCPRHEGKIIFACSDSLEAGNGYELLLKALGFLYKNAQMPQWELRVAGGGALFEAILEEARELRVDSRIAIFGSDHGADILKDCDILVVPADASGGSSLSVKEAWAAKLPVICSDLPGHKELVQDGANGILFRSGDAVDLAEKMFALATDESVRQKLAAAGFADLSRYSCKIMLERHLEIFERISREYNSLKSVNI